MKTTLIVATIALHTLPTAAAPAEKSDVVLFGMHSGISVSGFFPGGVGPGLTSSSSVSAWVIFSDTGDWCKSHDLGADWNPFRNDNIRPSDFHKDFQNWCGLGLPCSGDLVMGKQGPCGKGQAHHKKGDFYADVFDRGNKNKHVGRCEFTDPSKTKNCAKSGSDIYGQSLRCKLTSKIC
ncbi:hypothetical protein F5B20DRAFT_592075 [Whalleya microplaca]|nr:hypothetical protein F5B20DRAFT_592075 [Whalleya microplaca]